MSNNDNKLEDLYVVVRWATCYPKTNDPYPNRTWTSKVLSKDEAEKLKSKWEQPDYQPLDEEVDYGNTPNEPFLDMGVEMIKYELPRDRDDEVEETRTYKITGAKFCLDKLEQIFKFMAACGDMGTCQEFQVFYDGDGSAHLEISRTDKPVKFNTIENEEEAEKLLDEDDEISFDFA